MKFSLSIAECSLPSLEVKAKKQAVTKHVLIPNTVDEALHNIL